MLENQIIHFTLDFTENSNSESKKKWREEVSPLACMPDCRLQRAGCLLAREVLLLEKVKN